MDVQTRERSKAGEDASLKLWVVLSRAFNAVAAHVQADIARHGLTVSEFAILEALYHKGPLLLGELQRKVLVSSGGTTYLVDRLAAQGLVERRDCEHDRRARYAALTAEGEKRIAAIFPAHAEAVRHAMQGLTLDEQRHAVDLLRALGRTADQATPLHPPTSGRRNGGQARAG
jgi:MarR family transcriptional regulator, 2-MHQ and catechol-resistance regulon repressor